MKQVAVKAINAGVIVVGQFDFASSRNTEYLQNPMPTQDLERLGKELTEKLAPFMGKVPYKVCVGPYALSMHSLSEVNSSDNTLDNFSRVCEQKFSTALSTCVPPSLCKSVLIDALPSYEPQVGEELGCFLIPVSVLLSVEDADEVEQALYDALDEQEENRPAQDPWSVMHNHPMLENWSANQMNCCYARLWFFHEEEPYVGMKSVLTASQLALLQMMLSDSNIKNKSSLSLIGAIPVATDAQGGVRVGYCPPEIYCRGIQSDSIEEIEELYCLWHADYCQVIEGLEALGMPFSAVQYDPHNSRTFRHDHLVSQECVNDFMVVRHPAQFGADEQAEPASQVMHCVHLNPENEALIGVVIAGLDEFNTIVQRHVAYLVNPFNEGHLDYLRKTNDNGNADFSEQSDYLLLDAQSLGLAGPFVDEEPAGAPPNVTLH